MSDSPLPSNPKKRLAVLIDGENISSSHTYEVLKQVREWGQIGVCYLYNAETGWENAKKDYPFELRCALNPMKKLDAADFLIYMDAMELCLRDEYGINGIVLVSSDNGFYQLALRMRKLNKDFYLIAEEDKIKMDSVYCQVCTAYKLFKHSPAVSAKDEPSGSHASVVTSSAAVFGVVSGQKSVATTQSAPKVEYKVTPIDPTVKVSLECFRAACDESPDYCRKSAFGTKLSARKSDIAELKDAKSGFLAKFMKIEGMSNYYDFSDKDKVRLKARGKQEMKKLNLDK
jgi:hypothetical protein